MRHFLSHDASKHIDVRKRLSLLILCCDFLTVIEEAQEVHRLDDSCEHFFNVSFKVARVHSRQEVVNQSLVLGLVAFTELLYQGFMMLLSWHFNEPCGSKLSHVGHFSWHRVIASQTQVVEG
jgi:hypothetical protein